MRNQNRKYTMEDMKRGKERSKAKCGPTGGVYTAHKIREVFESERQSARAVDIPVQSFHTPEGYISSYSHQLGVGTR